MSNRQNNKISVRTAHPQTIAGAMGGLMRIFGVRASDADLVSCWDEIMGPEIAKIARPVAIRKTRDGRFTITLRPVNPAFTLQLSYMQEEIKIK